MTEIEQAQMRAAIGPRAGYYLAQFEKIEHSGGKWVAGKYTQSVVYDADKRMIVVTMGHKDYKDYKEFLHGKRLAMHAEEKYGAISWTCRSIDLERRYLPSACHN